jgi:signal peptidase
MSMKVVENIILCIGMLFIISAVMGFILDRPVFVSYVYSDSMSPTLEKGDVFFINPLSKGDVGDIIVFKMNGHWTVHRVFAVTERGYITKGDNNVATDQQSGRNSEVKSSDIIGVIITIGNQPVKIPKLGVYINEFSRYISNVYLAFAVLILGAVFLVGKSEKKRKKKKRIVRVKYRTIYAVTSVMMIAVIILSTMMSWGAITFSYASTKAGGQREGWYLPNSEFDEKIVVKNRGFYPFYYILKPEGDRIEINDEKSFLLFGGEEREITVHTRVPEDTRIYHEKIDIFAYLPLLPPSLIDQLYSISPYAPLLAFAFELATVLTVVYFLTGFGEEDVFRFRIRRVIKI